MTWRDERFRARTFDAGRSLDGPWRTFEGADFDVGALACAGARADDSALAP